MEAAGIVVAALLGVVALFQLALVLGAPWGDYAYGGRAQTVNGRLVPRYRTMSAAAVPILAIAVWIVLARSGVISGGDGWVNVGGWFVFGYLLLNTLGNLAAKTDVERYVMGAITATAAVATLFVAVG